ncbi:MAG: hypothetical protein FJ139_01945 [Deltaproteobacteria bacterium]|nr:hypothetical protein [Deltaproteobacteria bacterium]
MAVMQISVQLPNVPGSLTKLIDVLDKESITIKAVLAASSLEDSIIRLVVNNPQRAAAVFDSAHIKYELTPVLALEVPAHTAGLNAIIKPLSKAEINILYLYTTIDRIGKETIVILGVDKIDEATEVLKQHWINFVGDQVYSL